MSGITPAKKVEIFRLSMLYVHAGIAVACPYRGTMFDGVLVLRLFALYDNLAISVACPCGKSPVWKATSATQNGSQAIPFIWYRGHL